MARSFVVAAFLMTLTWAAMEVLAHRIVGEEWGKKRFEVGGINIRQGLICNQGSEAK